MMAPKVVIFDLGRVLLDFDYGIALSKILPDSALAGRGLEANLLGVELLFRYERGQMSTRGFFEAVREAIGYRGTFGTFATAFGDIFWEIPEMVRLHARLRAQGIPTYVLSNTNELAVAHIRRAFPFFTTFNGHVLSYEHGAMKPESRLYQAAERLSGCREGEILYLDDIAANVAAGIRRGWQAFLHEDPDRSTVLVEDLLSLPSSIQTG